MLSEEIRRRFYVPKTEKSQSAGFTDSREESFGNAQIIVGSRRVVCGCRGPAARANAAQATFVTADTKTQGNWQGVYGSNGYDMKGFPSNAPLASVALLNQSDWVWTETTTDPRALEIPTQSGRVAECWYNSQTFTLDVNLASGASQQVALYALDWDNEGRSETITILDADNPGTVLDSRSLPNSASSSPTYTNTTSLNFTGGTYLVWNISGHVLINITANIYPNAVISGDIF